MLIASFLECYQIMRIKIKGLTTISETCHSLPGDCSRESGLKITGCHSGSKIEEEDKWQLIFVSGSFLAICSLSNSRAKALI